MNRRGHPTIRSEGRDPSPSLRSADRSAVLRFCCADKGLAGDLRDVAECVYRHYGGDRDRRLVADPGEIREISLGGRAGVVGVRLKGRSWCVKLFYDQRLRTRLRVLLGLAKARRAYRNGLRLDRLDIRCPRMLGYAEKRPGQLPLIVTEWVTEAVGLDQWIARHGVSRPLIASLARFLRHMHDRGVTHLDLSPRNLLAAPSGKGFDLWLLDCEDARFRRHLSERRRLADLHHLDERLLCTVSLRDRLRFLRDYAGPKYPTWRDTLGRMMETSQSKYARQYRDRPNSRRGPV